MENENSDTLKSKFRKKLAVLLQKKNLPVTIAGGLLVVMLAVFAVGMIGQIKGNHADSAVPTSASGMESDSSSGSGTLGTGAQAGAAENEGTAALQKSDTVSSSVINGGSDSQASQGESSVSASSDGAASSGADSGYAVSGRPSDEAAENSSEAAGPDDFSGSKVSRQEFDALSEGMTYSQVVSAVGGEGNQTGKAGTSVTYEWSGYGSDGATVRIDFKGGKLAHKYQFGL